MKKCYKLNRKPLAQATVVIPSSRPTHFKITGADMTFSVDGNGNTVATYTNAGISGYKINPPEQPQIFYSTGLNRNLTDTEYSYNNAGTFVIKLNTTFTLADEFIVSLNW